MAEAFPLEWPSGWRRTPPAERKRASFSKEERAYGSTGSSWSRSRPLTLADARARLMAELDLLGADSTILSTNVELRLDGMPRSGQPEPDDPGVAVYIRWFVKPYCFACDRWDRVADNIAALAKHINAMRGMDRWGVGRLEQAFQGYLALPAPPQWWDVLGVESSATEAEIQAAYKRLAAKHHPDRGGSSARMAEINAGRDAALKELRNQSMTGKEVV